MEQAKSFSGWSFDDIVFLGRNQDYGAYQLRKERAKNSIIGLAVTVGLAGVLIGASFMDFSFLKSKPKEETIETSVTLAEPPPLKDETPPPPPPPPPPPVRPTVQFLEMVAKKDKEVVDEDPPQQEEVKKAEISTRDPRGQGRRTSSGRAGHHIRTYRRGQGIHRSGADASLSGWRGGHDEVHTEQYQLP
jgi:protein TonB